MREAKAIMEIKAETRQNQGATGASVLRLVLRRIQRLPRRLVQH